MGIVCYGWPSLGGHGAFGGKIQLHAVTLSASVISPLCLFWHVTLPDEYKNSVLSASDRGNTLKNIEKECNAKIMIRGKGSVKEGKVGRKDGQMLPGEDEPLHALVTANTMENVKKAVEQVRQPERKPIAGSHTVAPVLT